MAWEVSLFANLCIYSSEYRMLVLSTDTARQEVSDLLLLEDMKIWRGGWQQSTDFIN
jgi:hypothetical protein